MYCACDDTLDTLSGKLYIIGLANMFRTTSLLYNNRKDTIFLPRELAGSFRLL